MYFILVPPGIPVPVVNDTTRSSASLTWTTPISDGGSKVKGYIVEFLEEGSVDWVKASLQEIRSTEFSVDNLKEGGNYRFRVTAINAAGPGQPGEVPGIINIKDKIGLLHLGYS